MQSETVRGIVFDMDGVLIDSASCHSQAFVEAFQPYHGIDFEYARYAGWRTAEVVESVLVGAGYTPTAEQISQTARHKSLLARQKLADRNPVPDDCLPVLRQLAASYPLALASSGSRQSVQAFLQNNGCENLFRSVLTGDDVTRAKPDPEIYTRSFSALGLNPAECIVIEDATAGIEAARAAGAIAVGLAGTCSKQMLSDAGAQYTIGCLSDIPVLLGSRI